MPLSLFKISSFIFCLLKIFKILAEFDKSLTKILIIFIKVFNNNFYIIYKKLIKIYENSRILEFSKISFTILKCAITLAGSSRRCF